MLLTLSTTHAPATDLGYLLHKNPARLQSFELAFGRAHVFYPEATAERCTAALLLDVDPIELVRGRRGGGEGLLDQYVNDRPFVASSFLSVAIAQVFGSALGARCKDRPELVRMPIPLVAHLVCVPCRGGEELLRELFEPLGYLVRAERHELDARFPEWGASRYFDLELESTRPLAELLAHLYVLVPVLDDEKHYWVDEREVEKLLHHGGEWLARHPRRELIAHRYLRHQRRLSALALSRLADESDPDEALVERDEEEAAIERPLTLQQRRMDEVLAVLIESGARRVLDLGCGEGRLLSILARERRFQQIVGVDVSTTALARAADRLDLARAPAALRDKLTLLHGSLVYRDARLAGFDAAVAVEVVEHLEPHRLESFARNLLEFVRAPCTVVTTPNAEYNARFPGLRPGGLRHRDHRFEWTRAQFQAWAGAQAQRHGCTVEFRPVGDVDPELGPPTQMAIFLREAGT